MKNFTKKIITAVLLSVIGFTLFAEEIKEKVYLEVEIDGKIQGKWFDFFKLVEYDRNSNKVYEKSLYTGELWNEYDKNGNLIQQKDSVGTIYIHILEYWDDGKTLKKDITYRCEK